MANDQAVWSEKGFRVMAGRKNKYFTNIEPNLELITGYLSSGHTEASVAKRFGIGVSTWEKYKTEHEEFRDVIQKAGMNATALVVNAAHKRATGYEYEYEETQIVFYPPEKGEDGKVSNRIKEIKKVTKPVKIPPDTAAFIFWLVNRDPEHWQNTQNINHSGEIKNSGVLAVPISMSKDQWSKLAKEQQNGKEEKAK